jgi:pyruvate/2-oxoglutarate dehydrogenase complex dihydrolipoamide acyltransferase (E2) component
MKQILFLLAAVLLLGGCAEEKKTDVRWATFNIRYDNPQDSLNNWQYRKDRVCQFIKDHELDIVGMQEVLHNQFQDLRAGLPEYDGIGVGRDDGKTAGEYAPLFYRKDKYEVLDSNTFWLAENPDSVGMMGWDAVCVRIATWAKFKDKATGKIFMAVNTHFDHVGEEARRQSALLIIRKIKEIVGERPAVVTGDFNVTDASDAYETITTNEFVMKDAYKTAARVTGVDYTFHDFAQFGPIETKPLSRIQKISGANLARNWVMIPHVTFNDDCDITELEDFRKTIGKEWEKSGLKISPLAFIIKAAAEALKAFPTFNSSLDGDNLVLKQYYHIGFAADTPNGLVVPVIKDADKKGLKQIAKELTDLSALARDGKLKPTDMQGATFTISSLGGIGGTGFTPIVNAPEVAILGVCKSQIKPVWNGKEFAPRLMCPLSLSFDHRVIDGAAAARFTVYLGKLLSDVRRLIL